MDLRGYSKLRHCRSQARMRGLPLLPPRCESQRKGRTVHRPLTLRPPEAAAGGKKEEKKKKNKKKKEREVPAPSAQEPKEKKKVPRRSPAARSGDAIRVSAKDGESYAEILKAMKAKVDPQSSVAEVLSIRRTRKEEILLVLKKGGHAAAFETALDQAVGQRAEVKSLVSKKSVEIWDLDETITREEVVAALCIALGKPDLGDQCRLYKRFGGIQTAVVCLTEADARSLLGLGKLRVG